MNSHYRADDELDFTYGLEHKDEAERDSDEDSDAYEKRLANYFEESYTAYKTKMAKRTPKVLRDSLAFFSLLLSRFDAQPHTLSLLLLLTFFFCHCLSLSLPLSISLSLPVSLLVY